MNSRSDGAGRSLRCALLVVLAGQVHAQQPAMSDPSNTPVQDRIPVHSAPSDEGLAYGLWAAGAGYKASFHDGMTFVPYLGAQYPTTVTWQWRTTSVQVGGTELAGTPKPASVRGPYRVEYELGGVVEAYDVRSDGLEQTFVIPRPTGRGDLVLRGRVTTPLTAATTGPAHGELVFADAEGRAILRYAAVTAVDAKGRRRAMTTSHEDGVVTLRLDGDWLATASHPVVVDPLLSGWVLPVPGAAVDAVRDDRHATMNVWYAYVLSASATDQDLVIRRATDLEGGFTPAVFQDLTTSWSTFEPSLAYSASADRCVAAFTRHFPHDVRRVRLHVHAGGDQNANSAILSVPAAADQQFWRPDLGGTSSTLAGTAAVLVMQRESGLAAFANSSTSEIVGCVVDAAGSGGLGPVFDIVSFPAADCERPVVNQVETAALALEWLLVYQSRSTLATSNTSWDLKARKLDAGGGFTPAQVIGSGSATYHEFAAEVAGAAGRYLVGYASSPVAQVPVPPSGTTGFAIRAQRHDWPAGASSGTSGGVRTLNLNNDARVEVVGLSHDTDTRSHWGLLYRSTATQNLYFKSLGHRGDALQTETPSTPAGYDTSGGAVCFDDDHDHHLLFFHVGGSVHRSGFEYSSAQPWSAACIGCSPASIAWYGSQQIGSELCGVRVSGAPSGSLKVLFLGLAPANQLLVGIPGVQPGCWLLVPNAGPGHLAVLDGGPGTSQDWQLALPEFLSTVTLYAQSFHLDAGGTALQSTRRVAVELVK